MSSSSGEIDESRIRAYLLDQLPSGEALELAGRIATDPGFCETVEEIEEELFDDYARGRLSTTEAAAFREKYLRMPEDRARAEFANVFARGSSRTRHLRARSLALHFIAAVLIAVASFQAGRTYYDPAVGIDLRPGVVRSNGAAKVLHIPSRAPVIEFRLYPDHVNGGRVVILTLDEMEIASGPASPLPDGGRRFVVPADTLGTGVYILRLDSGNETVATFVVRIQKQ